jgi:hypothetical protein
MLAYVFAAFLLGLITGVVIGRLQNKSELRLYKAFVEDRLSREASLATISAKPKKTVPSDASVRLAPGGLSGASIGW